MSTMTTEIFLICSYWSRRRRKFKPEDVQIKQKLVTKLSSPTPSVDLVYLWLKHYFVLEKGHRTPVRVELRHREAAQQEMDLEQTLRYGLRCHFTLKPDVPDSRNTVPYPTQEFSILSGTNAAPTEVKVISDPDSWKDFQLKHQLNRLFWEFEVSKSVGFEVSKNELKVFQDGQQIANVTGLEQMLSPQITGDEYVVWVESLPKLPQMDSEGKKTVLLTGYMTLKLLQGCRHRRSYFAQSVCNRLMALFDALSVAVTSEPTLKDSNEIFLSFMNLIDGLKVVFSMIAELTYSHITDPLSNIRSSLGTFKKLATDCHSLKKVAPNSLEVAKRDLLTKLSEFREFPSVAEHFLQSVVLNYEKDFVKYKVIFDLVGEDRLVSFILDIAKRTVIASTPPQVQTQRSTLQFDYELSPHVLEYTPKGNTTDKKIAIQMPEHISKANLSALQVTNIRNDVLVVFNKELKQRPYLILDLEAFRAAEQAATDGSGVGAGNKQACRYKKTLRPVISAKNFPWEAEYTANFLCSNSITVLHKEFSQRRPGACRSVVLSHVQLDLSSQKGMKWMHHELFGLNKRNTIWYDDKIQHALHYSRRSNRIFVAVQNLINYKISPVTGIRTRLAPSIYLECFLPNREKNQLIPIGKQLVYE